MDIVISIPLDGDDGTAAELVRGILMGAAYGAAPTFERLGLPPLVQSGIVFAEDPEYGSGIERFPLPWEVYEAGEGDCNALVVYHLCDLIVRLREAPTVRCLWWDDDMHVQVRREGRRGRKGRLEDPAIICGAPADWPEWLLKVGPDGYGRG